MKVDCLQIFENKESFFHMPIKFRFWRAKCERQVLITYSQFFKYFKIPFLIISSIFLCFDNWLSRVTCLGLQRGFSFIDRQCFRTAFLNFTADFVRICFMTILLIINFTTFQRCHWQSSIVSFSDQCFAIIAVTFTCGASWTWHRGYFSCREQVSCGIDGLFWLLMLRFWRWFTAASIHE